MKTNSYTTIRCKNAKTIMPLIWDSYFILPKRDVGGLFEDQGLGRFGVRFGPTRLRLAVLLNPSTQSQNPPGTIHIVTLSVYLALVTLNNL